MAKTTLNDLNILDRYSFDNDDTLMYKAGVPVKWIPGRGFESVADINAASIRRPAQDLTFDSFKTHLSNKKWMKNLFKIKRDKEGSKIHIKKKNEGKFTESANKAGMSVQEFAAHVLANKGKYSPTLVKRANFARNASKWKHRYGGRLIKKNYHV